MNGEDEQELNPGEMPWGELDEAGFRKNLRERLKVLPDVWTYEQRVQAFSRMFDIMREEVAIQFQPEISRMTYGCDTRADATAAAEDVNRDLARLGLAIKHPETGEPSRLGIMRVIQPGKQWFQIEPISGTSSSRSYPVPSYSRDPKDRYKLIPAPLDEIAQGRGKGRS